MSRLKVDNIEPRSGNNVAIDNPMNLKSYTTAQRDALTSVAGDMIYNSTDSKVQVHNGSAWDDLGATLISADFLVVGGGGGAGSRHAGGGGAGGLRTSSGTSGGGASAETAQTIVAGQSYTVAVGAGGPGFPNDAIDGLGVNGGPSLFASIISIGGGGGSGGRTIGSNGGSGGGGGGNITFTPGSGTTNQGFGGGTGSSTNYRGGAGGGAGGVGSNAADSGAAGGVGVSNSLSGSAVTYATGGKGSGTYFAGDGPDGGANTGDGGGALRGDGGSGIVIIKFSDSYTCTVGAGLTSSSSTAGGFTTISFTAGTGTVTFS
jgi:hypothetical protein